MRLFDHMYNDYANWGWRGIPLGISKYLHRRLPLGQPSPSIWDREWDMIVILDSCRPEWIQEVSSEYDFITNVGTINSVGSHSMEWVDKTFKSANPATLEESIYITGNHYARRAPEDKFSEFEDLNNYSGEFPAPPAHVITDRTVAVCREQTWRHCIVHYMQPHKPFLQCDSDRRNVEIAAEWSKGHQLYHQYFKENITKQELIDGFINNLRYVLDEVDLLLDNVDAPKTVITSDHGQALGERFIWDHHPGVQIEPLKKVPWVECTAKDKQTLNPKDLSQVSESNEPIEDRLEQLGYM